MSIIYSKIDKEEHKVIARDLLAKVAERLPGENFICCALNSLELDPRLIKYRIRNILVAWVRELLGGAVTYESWMRTHHFAMFNGVASRHTRDKLAYEARLRWIKWMQENV